MNSSAEDSKLESLREEGTLHPHPEEVRDGLFQESEFFDPHDLLQVKYEMLRRVEKERSPITEATAAFGFSRPSFYLAQTAFQGRPQWACWAQTRTQGSTQAHKRGDGFCGRSPQGGTLAENGRPGEQDPGAVSFDSPPADDRAGARSESKKTADRRIDFSPGRSRSLTVQYEQLRCDALAGVVHWQERHGGHEALSPAWDGSLAACSV